MAGGKLGPSDLGSEMDGGSWCVCGVRHRSERRVTWANLEEEQLESPSSDGNLYLGSDQFKPTESIWVESQNHRKVSWNLEDDEQGDGKFVTRSRKMKKDDMRTSWQMAEKKGKVGG